MRNIYITTTIAALLCTSAFARTYKTTKADRLFENWEYFKASQLYEKAATKHPTADTYFKLGECYRKMNRYKEEQAAYEKVDAMGGYYKPEFYLNYGKVLRNNGKDVQAKSAFDKYTLLMPKDTLGKYFGDAIGIVDEDHKSDEPIRMTNVKPLNSANADFCAVAYEDGLVFTSSRNNVEHGKIYSWTGSNYNDLYYAKKGTNDTNYNSPTIFGGKKIEQKYHDGPATFSKDFETMYFSRVEKDLKGEEKKTLKIERNKIYSSTNKNGEWSKAEPFVYNSDLYSVANPFLAADGRKLYFVSDMQGGFGETDIWYCNREGDRWGSPVNMGPSVNTFNREKYPNIDSTGNFYFSSDGYQGFGGLDICVATLKDGRLQKAIPMKYPFNSNKDDLGITFIKDNKIGYITSNRAEGGMGDEDIFYYNLPAGNLTTQIYTIGYVKPLTKEEVIAMLPVPDTTSLATILSEPVFKNKTIFDPSPMPMDMHVYFDFDKSNIRKDAIAGLDSVVKFMKASPNIRIILDGNCDSKGSDEYNIVLSNKRNKAAIAYLTSKGINRKRITANGYGLRNISNGCTPRVVCSDAKNQMNRNVGFHFEDKTTAK